MKIAYQTCYRQEIFGPKMFRNLKLKIFKKGQNLFRVIITQKQFTGKSKTFETS